MIKRIKHLNGRIRIIKYTLSQPIHTDSIQATLYPEIANTCCHIRKHHRRLYVYMYGKLEKGLEICHKCDEIYGPCVNPKHWFIGTHGDNMRDCVKKKRNGTWNNNKIWGSRNKEQKRENALKGWETRIKNNWKYKKTEKIIQYHERRKKCQL